MWVFTKRGFVSVVKHRDYQDKMMVRARVAGDIEQVFGVEATKTPDADYLYRAVIDRDAFARAMVESIDDIDYDNFKNSVEDERWERHDAYLGVWAGMVRLQGKLDENH